MRTVELLAAPSSVTMVALGTLTGTLMLVVAGFVLAAVYGFLIYMQGLSQAT